jgi:hypothetical protein
VLRNSPEAITIPERGNMNESIVSIDESQLDKEWLNQPGKMEDHCKALAGAKEILAHRKAKLSVIEAEVEFIIRANPKKFIKGSTTERTVKAATLLHPRYQKGQRRVIVSQKNVDMIQATVTALDHRKKALENLVTLHGQSYFSTPRVKNNETFQGDMSLRKKDRIKKKLKKYKPKGHDV